MSLGELLSRLDKAAVRVKSPEPGRVILAAVFPERRPLSPGLVAECRRRKPELLAWIAWTEKADTLLLESVHTLAAEYPAGCHALEQDPNWSALEDELGRIYQMKDLEKLTALIARREEYARRLFEAHRERRQ